MPNLTPIPGGSGGAAQAVNSPRYTAFQVLGGIPVSPRSHIFTSQTASNGTDMGQNSKTAHQLTAATSFVTTDGVHPARAGTSMLATGVNTAQLATS